MEQRKILESWKEIAAHLRRNIRTCQMWERKMGLPIHRLDGSPKARVFAYPGELDRWLEDKLHEREPGAAIPEPGKALDKAEGQSAALRSERRQAVLPTLPRWNISLIAGLGAVSIAAVAAMAWLLDRQAKIRWANDVAIPEIERLLTTPDRQAPFSLLLRVEKTIPKSPKLASLRPLIASTISFVSEPPGADVWIKDYGAPDTDWRLLGRTPVAKTRVCQGYMHWRAEKEGFAKVEGAFLAQAGYDHEVTTALDRQGVIPPGMVRVLGGKVGPNIELKDYFLDKYEVTNRQYKEFVDAGGYSERRFWKIPFIKDGRTVPWEEGIREFVDETGRPGPATWRLGDYPLNQADFPVSGVSWYEAAAYAEYAGKRLPSSYHWQNAAGNPYANSNSLIPASNFEGKGQAPVGNYKGLTPFGNYDMAGNVKEWCWNEIGRDRLSHGGAWNEAQYVFYQAHHYPAFMRADNFGFRCIKEIRGNEAPEDAFAPLQVSPRLDYRKFKPCSDEIFEVYRSLYAYTKSDLAAKVESVLEWSEDTTVEKVSFNTGYDQDRMIAYLFLPRHGRPPFQTVVYAPGASAWLVNSVFEYDAVKNREVELYTRGGRAFVFLLFRGALERKVTLPEHLTPEQLHDEMVWEHRDVARCLDYLETRPDFDSGKLAFEGLSGGAIDGPVLTALESRFKAAIFLSGGPWWYPASPEWDPMNFAPRVRVPVLMQNGRFDHIFQWDTKIVPLFALLGTPSKDKHLIGYPCGHSVWYLNEYRKDLFDFLDKYLGPVTRGTP